MSQILTPSPTNPKPQISNFIPLIRIIRKKYLPACIKERRSFTPFVDSVDGLIRVKVEATLKRLPSRLAKKWKEPYSHTCS